ncbi:hypothetical protein [Clostridium sp. C2-6-12]|nr:hypothetical protein [Clostridium sp. C2-6-12]
MELQKKWLNIEEIDPTQEEMNLYKEYKNKQEEVVSLENVVRELKL